MLDEQKYSKEYIRRQKEKEAQVKIESQKRDEQESIKDIAKNVREFVNDGRYKAYRLLLENLLQTKVDIRNMLKDSAKDLDEYTRRGLVIDAEIGLLKTILEIPETFFSAEQQINNSKGEQI